VNISPSPEYISILSVVFVYVDRICALCGILLCAMDLKEFVAALVRSK
jgi:hypothetical protein